MAASQPFNTTLLNWTQTQLTSKKHRLPHGNVKPCASRQQTRDLVCMQVYQLATIYTLNHDKSELQDLQKRNRLSQPHTDCNLFPIHIWGPKLSYQQDSPVNHRPEYPCSTLSSLQLVKKQQDKHEASPKDTYTAYDLLSSIHYSMHLQDLQMPFFISASCTLCSVPSGHFHEPSLSDSFSYTVADDFFKQKWKIRLVKSKLLVLLVTCRGSCFQKLGFCPTGTQSPGFFHAGHSSKGQ